jgi:hypothetical protein
MNMMEGRFALAISKSCFTNFSDSPSHFDTKSDEDTEKKVEFEASVATALAMNDFPVPGGPKRRIPRHGFRLPKIK